MNADLNGILSAKAARWTQSGILKGHLPATESVKNVFAEQGGAPFLELRCPWDAFMHPGGARASLARAAEKGQWAKKIASSPGSFCSADVRVSPADSLARHPSFYPTFRTPPLGWKSRQRGSREPASLISLLGEAVGPNGRGGGPNGHGDVLGPR